MNSLSGKVRSPSHKSVVPTLVDIFSHWFTLTMLYLSGVVMLSCPSTVYAWLVLDTVALGGLYLQRCTVPPAVIWFSYQRKTLIFASLGFGTLWLCFAIDVAASDPAYGFFSDAEEKLKACFDTASGAIGTVFMLLRLILVLVIATQLIFAVIQISRGENPLPLLMPAIAIIAAIAIATFVTDMVVSGNSCAPATGT